MGKAITIPTAATIDEYWDKCGNDNYSERERKQADFMLDIYQERARKDSLKTLEGAEQALAAYMAAKAHREHFSGPPMSAIGMAAEELPGEAQGDAESSEELKKMVAVLLKRLLEGEPMPEAVKVGILSEALLLKLIPR